MGQKLINRFYAFGVHLLISICCAALVAILVFSLLYPGPLALASGVRDVFVLMLIVDVVLGPVITLIVFNPKKKELKRDLAIVGIVQIAALLYGLHTVYIARPAYVVFTIDRFDLVFANDLVEEQLEKAPRQEYRSLPIFGPELVAARQPENAKDHDALLFGALSGGPDLQHLPKYYVPYSELKKDLIKKIQPLDKLKEFNKGKSQEVSDLINKYSNKKNEFGYLPLKGKAKDLVVVVNYGTGEVVEMVDLIPWN